jgi:cytochrome c-type biogenesis protein
MTELSLLVIFFAGLLSFLSPCVLPLVPPYLAYMAGISVGDMAEAKETRRRVLFTACVFVLGFSTVFILMGAGASSIGRILRVYADPLSKVAGIVIILMGLHFLGVFRIGLLYREARMDVGRPTGFLGAYLMGLAFAFGWTPCIGPVLGSVMAVAASQASVTRGMGYLAVYSLGLGLPFLLAAAFMGPFMRLMGSLKSRMGLIEKIMGVLLVLTGLAFLFGGMAIAAGWLLDTFPALGNLG